MSSSRDASSRAVRRSHGAVLRWGTAGLGVVLLGVAVVSTVASGRANAVSEIDHTLDTAAVSDASALQEYFERAESVNLLLAADSVFQQFAPGASGSVATRASMSAEANEALAYLETLYPGRISEACLIDSTGQEIARVVQGTIAPADELSAEEADNPFFAPTLALPAGRVYQAAPYISGDTGEWVISNSTPLVTASGQAWGMVHFEVALESFLPATAGQGTTAAIVDTRTGDVVLDTERPLELDALGHPGSAELQALVGGTGSAATTDGRRVAVARVDGGADNANSWAVVVSAPVDQVSWSGSVGTAPVAMALAAVLLLTFAGLNLRSSHRQLRQVGLHDSLTGLPNRRQLLDRVDHALATTARSNASCAVLLIDLDRFKEVNDSLGHHYGDELLRAVGVRLGSVCRSSDTVARLGGDEFAVLLPEVVDEATALALADRCLAALHQPFTVEGIQLDIEASIGLALSPQHGLEAAALLRAADVAMYEAKDGSRGVVVYQDELDVHAPTRLALLGDLRRALQNGELVLDYQPKVSLGSGQIHGAEALVRWHHPVRGLIPPDAFIPIAEKSELVVPLTLQTLEQAVAQAVVWRDRGTPVQVAVNLSPRCLLQLGLPAMVDGLLQRHGLPTQLLRLEITETTFMADPARALVVLEALERLGIALSVDDFGTGYSSMSYLKRLPVDELKIDRSFITTMRADVNDAILVRSSIDLAHDLGMTAVAEGVEDEETLQALAELGCDLVQGFHLGRPMSADALTDRLEGNEVRSAQPTWLTR